MACFKLSRPLILSPRQWTVRTRLACKRPGSYKSKYGLLCCFWSLIYVSPFGGEEHRQKLGSFEQAVAAVVCEIWLFEFPC